MADFRAGQQLFDGRREYPLAKVKNTRDYILYFVPASDKYGKAARYFFNKFYKNHVAKDARSLEDAIAQLESDAKKSNTSHIREIVFVAHGTPIGLLLPVVDGVTGTTHQKYKYLTPATLALLQQEFSTEFAPFFERRKAVIARLTEDSWVTVRACNFGQSRAGLYALYSFFGGRANVYTPKVFQFFGTHPIRPGMRFETKLEVHGHLARQRFLPKDVHTPDRADAVVRFLADPARFSAPVDLFTADLSNKDDPRNPTYEEVISDLNRRRIANALDMRLLENGITPTNDAEVIVRVRHGSWVIRDTLKHGKDTHPVEYHISERLELPTGTLQVEATLPDVHSAREFFPIQLFFTGPENDDFIGRLFILASYMEDPEANPAHEARFNEIQALLDALTQAQDAAAAKLVTLFKDEEGIELTGALELSVLSEVTRGGLVWKTWLLKAQVEYSIKLEHLPSPRGFAAHTLSVFERLDQKAALKREYELMARIGADSDQPGTELLSYLDKFSFDDLTNLIDYLRNPYRPEHALYIHHAIQAIRRKKDSQKWADEHPATVESRKTPDPLYGLHFPYVLSDKENQDKQLTAYDFETREYWAEVKASNPPVEPFRDDLFTEQTLVLAPNEALSAEHLEAESPATDLEELRVLESQGVEAYFAADKPTDDEPEEDPNNISCQKFAELIELMKSLQGKSQAEIEAALNDFKLVGDSSFFKTYVIPKPIYWALQFLAIVGDEPAIPEKIVRYIIARRPSMALGAFRLTPVSVHVARGLAYYGLATLVGEMFWNFVKEYHNAREEWKYVGKATAIRRYARKLHDMTLGNESSFPETLDIQIEENVVDAYFAELISRHRYNINYPIRHLAGMQEGFDEGLELIAAEAKETLSKSDRIIDQGLRMGGLDTCKIRVLRDAGIIDPATSRALVMRKFAELILREVPTL